MIQHQGIWLPDGETHLIDWMSRAGEFIDGKGTYQIKKLRKALTYCASFRTAVDVGAHCGMWSMQLAKQFKTLHAFEPMTEHVECFYKNVEAGNVILHQCALGDEVKSVGMHTTPHSSGDTYVEGDGDVTMLRLDSFELQDVDFLKADCEGGELFVLRGGEQTIKRCRPTIIVEQKPGKAQHFGLGETDAVTYLQSLGYRVAAIMAGDYICIPEDDLREAARETGRRLRGNCR